MNKSKAGWRDPNGHYSKKRSTSYIVSIWLASFLSVGLVILIGNFVKSDFAAFKSCSTNDQGLVLKACGKQSLNVGDLALIGLFVLACIMTTTLFTGAIRTIRRRA